MKIKYTQKLKITVSLLSLLILTLLITKQPNLTNHLQTSSFIDTTDLDQNRLNALNHLASKRIVTGHEDGSFDPDRTLNRAEVSKIIILATQTPIQTTDTPHFPDVQPEDWFSPYIETMYHQGWINGYPDGYFEPEAKINRAELAKILVNAFAIPPSTKSKFLTFDVFSNDWFYPYVKTALHHGILTPKTFLFLPDQNVSRIDTVLAVYQAIEYQNKNTKSSAPEPKENTILKITTTETHKTTIVPHNATAIPYLSLQLSATGLTPITLSEITFQRQGLGSSRDFDRVWLEKNDERITYKKSINVKDHVTFVFSPPLEIHQNHPTNLTLIASHEITEEKRNVGHTNQFIITSIENIHTNATTTEGNFPLQGPPKEIVNYDLSGLLFTPRGNKGYVSIGETFVEIGKFQLQNVSGSRKNITLKKITLQNTGKADLANDVTNLQLYDAHQLQNTPLSQKTIINDDEVTFTFQDITIEGGENKTFSLRADIRSNEGGNNIQFRIESNENILATESGAGSNFGITVLQNFNQPLTKSSSTLQPYTIRAGDLVITRAPESYSNRNYSPGAQDIVLLKTKINLSQAIEVEGIKFRLGLGSVIKSNTGTTAADNQVINEINRQFSNFRLYLNDRNVDYTNTFEGSATNEASLNFDNRFEIPSSSTLIILANAKQEATEGTKFKLQLKSEDIKNPKYIANEDAVPTDQLIGLVEGSFIEIRESSLKVVRTDGFVDGETLVMGIQDFPFMRFVLDNNDVGTVNISALKLNILAEGLTNTTLPLSIALFVDETQEGSSRKLDQDLSTTFQDIAIRIPSSGQKEVVVKIDSYATSIKPTTLQINLQEIQTENIENGRSIKVTTTNGTSLNQSNPLSSARFTPVDSGSLTITKGATIYSDIITANQTNKEVLDIWFNSVNDAITVQEFTLINDIDQDGIPDFDATTNTDVETRLNFKVFNESGKLLKQKRMANGQVHFQLGSGDQIQVPKDDNTKIRIKIDTSPIQKSNQTGKRLRLALASSNGPSPSIKAVTHSTGMDLTTPSNSWETGSEPLRSEEFILHKSHISITHSATQPHLSGPNTASQEVYRFTVTAHNNAIDLGRITIDLNIQGMKRNGEVSFNENDFLIRKVQSDGNLTSQIVDTLTLNTATEKAAQIQVNFSNERLSQNESRTYALFMANTINDGTHSNDDSIAINILRDDTYALPTTKANQQINHKLVWSDESDALHSDTTQDWLNGYLIEITSGAFINQD